MPAPSRANSVVLTWAASALEQHASQVVYAQNIVIWNNCPVFIYIATDGGTATVAGAHEEVLYPAIEGVFQNLQPMVNANSGSYQNGVTTAFDQSNGIWNAQQNNLAMYPDTAHACYVSIIPSVSTTGTVTITFQ